MAGRDANPLRYLVSKTWEHSAGNRAMIVRYWLMFIVANAILLFSKPLIVAKIMNVIQQQGVTRNNISFLLALLAATIGSQLVFWALHGPARIIERTNAFIARLNYRKYLLHGVMALPTEWHSEHHSGDTIDKIEKGTSALYGFSEDSFEVIEALVRLAVSYAMLVYFSRPAAYIILAMILVTTWMTMRFDRLLIAQYTELNRSENRVSKGVYDALSNITTVIILRVERLVFRSIIHAAEMPFSLFRRNSSLNEMKWFLINICCAVMAALVLGTYFYQNMGSGHGILLGNVYILTQYLDRISELFARFTRMYGDILQGKAKVMNAEELAADFRGESLTSHVLPENWQRLRVERLTFSYPDGEGALHLNNLSLSFDRGERIALVGASGSGKTTFLKIARDLYRPQSLALSVDGKAIPQGFEGISRAIALVPQDPEIFATTILENITLGAEYDLKFVRRFTDMAIFTDVAEGCPNQFNSSINEKGVDLSGGERQRLALSRGLLACHDKDIVLLDEPTSSVDIANEMKIYQNIFREFSDKLIISSVHRLHLLPLFHRVYFFHDGQILASGSLSEILSSCPNFQNQWQQYHRQPELAT
jgi:ATP-binding cassette subfamily B protein